MGQGQSGPQGEKGEKGEKGDSPIGPDGKLNAKRLRIENDISMGGDGEFSVDFPGVPGGRFVIDNQGNIKSRGDANIGGNVNVPSGKAVNVRDQFHGMSFKEAYDGPALYGYAGGGLGTNQQDGYKEALKWNRAGDVNITGSLDVNGNFTIKGKPFSAGSGSTDFDAFTNGHEAKFSEGWVFKGEKYWDPSIRGGNDRTGYAHTNEEFDADTSNRTADIAVPAGMKSGFLFHLPWVNCRHFDIWGVLNNGQEVFIRRVNAFQNVRNDQKDNFHDGAAVVPITRVDRFTQIRIKGVRGRIHYMGTGWTKNPLDSYASGSDSGFVSAQNIVGLSDIINANKGPITGVNFINNWQGDATNTTSQIANDTGDYKALMITGNRSNDKTRYPYKDYSDSGKGIFGNNRRNVQVWDDLSLPENSAQVCIGPRWCIRAEGDALVFRDMKTPGDNRYAMGPGIGNNVDINNMISNGQAITIRSDKEGKEQRRLQRDNDEVARFSNNNRGNWERFFIEKL
jgi:hypothetical protein